MKGVAGWLVIAALVRTAHAQMPTGNVAGTVTDALRAVVSGVQVTVVNTGNGWKRVATTSVEGRYIVDAVHPGDYRVTVEAPGFKTLHRDARVEAATTTTVDVVLDVGSMSESVVVDGAVPLMRFDHHQVGGVVRRSDIESLPLNGRNFLELAKLEPGVGNLVVATNNRALVPILGSGLQTVPRVGYTAMTVDGGSVTFPGSLGSGMQVSPDVVQEFQIATVDFNASTNPTSTGAVNIVTRAGGNIRRGTGFYFHRDHHLSAYPGLRRDPNNPNPRFARRQAGGTLSGPIRADRAFFFASYERTDQDSVFSVQPIQFPELGGIFRSPYDGNQFSARLDAQLLSHHQTFVRVTRDGNRGFGPGSGPASATLLPSAWTQLANRADQALIGVTSMLSATIVNDARVSYFVVDSTEDPADAEVCARCVGLGAPRITVQNAGLALGNARTLSILGRRFQLTDNLAWLNGSHGFRVGANWERSMISESSLENDPAQVTLFSPQLVRQGNHAAPTDGQIPLPASFVTLDDIVQLPLRSYRTSVGPSIALQRDFAKERIIDLYRVFFSDTWRAHPRVTINAGLSWVYEPNALNYDLTRPALLTPILGPGGLGPPRVQRANWSPMVGMVWSVSSAGKTLIHAGAGRYYDPLASTNSGNLLIERYLLSPLGTGRLTESGSNIRVNGRPLDFRMPTRVTGAFLLATLPHIRSQLATALNPDNRDPAVRNLDRSKEATSLLDPSFRTPYAVHVNAGVQHELAARSVVSADIVWKRFSHTFLSGIDYNRWNSAIGPAIPACPDEQRTDVMAMCSNGPFMFSNTAGWARYRGMLVRVNTDLGRGTRLRGSYALGSYVGSNGPGTGSGFNIDDWRENDGPLPTDVRHSVNVAAVIELPRRIQVAFSVSASSAPPLSAYVGDVDFNGDGTVNDLLPGSTVNQLGRGLGPRELAQLVQRYNEQHTRAPITLPRSYTFNDIFSTTDLRITHTVVRGTTLRWSVIGEVFNLFNTANLVGFSGNMSDAAVFGQPQSRFTQVFGSGGPRAVQLATQMAF